MQVFIFKAIKVDFNYLETALVAVNDVVLVHKQTEIFYDLCDIIIRDEVMTDDSHQKPFIRLKGKMDVVDLAL